MSNLAIDLYWQRGESALLLGQYSAAHQYCSVATALADTATITIH